MQPSGAEQVSEEPMPIPRPFLMFTGDALAAMDLYVSTFPDSGILATSLYDTAGPGRAGTVKIATFTLCGREFMCSDSPVKHAFTFTPSSSIFVEFEDMASLERTIAALSQGGHMLMPPGNYGFSAHFCWLNDRFGVSWQLSLADR
jgi:predicted 3-demethylubiquinone-9 3-methyltransferase (glyoxalase superfamily)